MRVSTAVELKRPPAVVQLVAVMRLFQLAAPGAPLSVPSIQLSSTSVDINGQRTGDLRSLQLQRGVAHGRIRRNGTQVELQKRTLQVESPRSMMSWAEAPKFKSSVLEFYVGIPGGLE